MPEEPDDSPLPRSLDDETQLLTPPTGGAPLLPRGAAPAREVIGDYEVLAKLGAGGMGAVYRARQVSLGRLVALKILPPQMIEDEDSVRRFQREARVAAGLSHANLVRVYAAGEAEGCHYIAMELIEGEDLGRRLKHAGRLPAPEALRICAEAARGLEYAWRTAHLIHRDIKPANIFIAENGDVKLGDLGLAKSTLGTTTGLTQTGTMMGTPHYMSPEQARGDREIDFRADIYSLGCTLYHMLAGQAPYGGTDAVTIIRQHLDAPLPAILKVWPQCPVALARLVGRMLKKSRHERPASYTDLITQIEAVWAQIEPLRFQSEAPTLVPGPVAPPVDSPLTPRSTATILPSIPPPAKSRLPLCGGLTAGVLILGLAAFLLWPKEEKLTKAQLYAKEHAGTPPGAEATPAPFVSPTAPISKPAAIKLSDAPERINAKQGIAWEDGAVRLDSQSLQFRSPLSRDMIFRAAVRMNPDARSACLAVRTSGERNGDCYQFALGARSGEVALKAVLAGKYDVELLQRWKLPRAYGPDEWLRLEIRARGDELTVLADGELLGTVRDTSVPGPGGVMLYASAKGYFRDIEYVPLDGASAATITTAEPWQDVLHDPAKLRLSGAVERVPEGLRFTDAGSAVPSPRQGPQRDGAVRMRTNFGGIRAQLRARQSTAGDYQLTVRSENVIELYYYDIAASHGKIVHSFTLREPLQPGQDYELELRAVGPVFTVKFNSEVLGTVTDGTFPEGKFGAGVATRGGAPTLVKSLEILDLDAPAPAR